jgi:septal ring factor EnvC (AmiA/AmiB activator)
MYNQDCMADLARLRKEVRRLDHEIVTIRNESKRFRQMGFGREIKDGQLIGLEAERDQCLRRIAKINGRASRGQSPKRGVADWLLIPVALLAMGLQAMQPKRRQTVSARSVSRRAQVQNRRSQPSARRSQPQMRSFRAFDLPAAD